MESLVVRSQHSGWQPVPGHDATGLSERWLLPISSRSPNFDVRHVVVHAGGVSKDHRHSWEQANYVLSGSGRVVIDGETIMLGTGDFVFFPADCRHCFHNSSNTDPLVLLCVQGPKGDAERR